jgi:hypothetical protein
MLGKISATLYHLCGSHENNAKISWHSTDAGSSCNWSKCRYFPRKVVFAPKDRKGLNI